MKLARLICIVGAGVNVGLAYGFPAGFATYVFGMLLSEIIDAIEGRKP